LEVGDVEVGSFVAVVYITAQIHRDSWRSLNDAEPMAAADPGWVPATTSARAAIRAAIRDCRRPRRHRSRADLRPAGAPGGEPGRDRGAEEGRRLPGERAEADQILQPGPRQHVRSSKPRVGNGSHNEQTPWPLTDNLERLSQIAPRRTVAQVNDMITVGRVGLEPTTDGL
jgi:hypothetical protein